MNITLQIRYISFWTILTLISRKSVKKVSREAQKHLNNIWVISPIINKRLYLTLFDLATTSWVFTTT